MSETPLGTHILKHIHRTKPQTQPGYFWSENETKNLKICHGDQLFTDSNGTGRRVVTPMGHITDIFYIEFPKMWVAINPSLPQIHLSSFPMKILFAIMKYLTPDDTSRMKLYTNLRNFIIKCFKWFNFFEIVFL